MLQAAHGILPCSVSLWYKSVDELCRLACAVNTISCDAHRGSCACADKKSRHLRAVESCDDFAADSASSSDSSDSLSDEGGDGNTHHTRTQQPGIAGDSDNCNAASRKGGDAVSRTDPAHVRACNGCNDGPGAAGVCVRKGSREDASVPSPTFVRTSDGETLVRAPGVELDSEGGQGRGESMQQLGATPVTCRKRSLSLMLASEGEASMRSQSLRWCSTRASLEKDSN